ncbi:MAG: NAD-dependent epimerase/dehydratase family protein [Promethearchaeota archaeon]
MVQRARVLVTGGLGGLGRHACRAILDAGHELSILAHRSRKYSNWFPPGTVVYGDITDPGTYRHLLPGLDAVIHLAFLLPPASENHLRAEEINVGGTRELVRALEELNPGCRLVFPSSVTAYGITVDETPPIRVDHPLRATNEYTRHKIECEELIRSSEL